MNYEHGLPFSEVLAKNIDDQKTRVKRGKPTTIVIDGFQGEGKTTLSIHCAKYLNPSFDKKKFYCSGGEQFQSKFMEATKQKIPVIIYDEAGDFDKRGSLTRFNALLNRIFDIYRQFEIVVFLVLPTFLVLDDSIFQKGVPRLLLHCHNRTLRQGNIKGYGFKRMCLMRYYAKKLPIPAGIYNIFTPNFRGHFLDLDFEERKELKRLSLAGKKEMLQQGLIKYEGLMSYLDIAKALHKSVIWVKKKVSELKIKHYKIIKRKKYFKKEVVDWLLDEEE